MKLYQTNAVTSAGARFSEFKTSAGDASKLRTSLKTTGHKDIKTEEVEIDATRSGIIEFLNARYVSPVTSKAEADAS